MTRQQAADMLSGAAESSYLDPQGGSRDSALGVVCFETARFVPSDTPPPTRSYLLILLKQLKQLGTKYI